MEDIVDKILNPQSIAIIGASKDPAKRGYRAIKTLLVDGYKGDIIPVNPKESEILGLKCYPNLASVSQHIDVALVFTPARTLPSVIEECGRKQVKGAVIVAGGFSEAGEEGRLLEEQSVEVAKRFKVRLVGPNMNGIFSARHSCNAIGWYNIPRGNLAVISNSSNIALSLLIEAQARGHLGFSVILSVGNQADLQFHEYLKSVGQDDGTKAVISYVEGIKNGRDYFNTARSVTTRKPVVVYKAGRNGEGVRLAKSHSGSLAGEYSVTSAALKQAGVTIVDRSDYLLPLAEALSLLPQMRSRRVGIISEGGGPITIAAEAFAERSMILPELTEETQQKIRAIVPHSTLVSNPVDVGSGTLPCAKNYGSCARAMLEDPNIDALLFVGYFGGYTTRYGKPSAEQENQASEELVICAALGGMMKEFGKPIVVQSHYAQSKPEALELLRQSGVPYHRSIELAAECICAVADYSAASRRLKRQTSAPAYAKNKSAQEIVDSCRTEKRSALLEFEARELLNSYGVPSLPYAFIATDRDAAEAVKTLGLHAFCVKVMSEDILHKSEAGGVVLNVEGEAALRAAFQSVIANGRKYMPNARIRGALVTPMADRGVELIIGVARDAQFGPVIMFGLGGVFVEVMKDIVFRVLPLSVEDAEEMLDEIKGKAVLGGVRGAQGVDKPALIRLLLAVSAICQAHPEFGELDLNPVIANESGYSIADIRIILTPDEADVQSSPDAEHH